MCYSTSLRKEREAIERQLYNQIPAVFEDNSDFEPFYHLNGFTHGKLQVITLNEPHKIQSASWGIIPDWAIHDPLSFRKKSNTLNARSESIFEKASFRDSAESKRCLILADGFFEPHHQNGIAIPYFCYQESEDHSEGNLFLFAGLYNSLGDGALTTTILTTKANTFFETVHNKAKRMPLVLDQHYYEDWLDDGLNIPQLNEIMAVGMTQIPFKAHPVSKDLYKRNIDTNKPYIIEEIDKGSLF